MALPLPYILGDEPRTAAVVLVSFLEQHMLFDAFANKLSVNNSNIQFLAEFATVCGMIGLLLLVFRPSLWKIKYIVCWFFLFLVTVLGASTGNFFGYNLGETDQQDLILGAPANANISTICDESMTATVGLCKNGAGMEAANEASKQVTGNPLPTVLKTAADKDASMGLNFISGNNLGIIGFMPQVIALYVTNLLKVKLRDALNSLHDQNLFKQKMEFIRLASSAEIPNPNMAIWINAFDKLCGQSVKNKLNMNVSTILGAPERYGDAILNGNLLSVKPFSVIELLNVINQSMYMYKSDNQMIPPMLDLGVSDEGVNLVRGIGKEIETARFIDYFTVHAPAVGEVPDIRLKIISFFKGEDASEERYNDLIKGNLFFFAPSEDNSDVNTSGGVLTGERLQDRLNEILELRFVSDPKGYKDSMPLFASLSEGISGGLVLVMHDPEKYNKSTEKIQEINTALNEGLILEDGTSAPIVHGNYKLSGKMGAAITSEKAGDDLSRYKVVTNCQQLYELYTGFHKEVFEVDLKNTANELIAEKLTLSENDKAFLEDFKISPELYAKLKMLDFSSALVSAAQNGTDEDKTKAEAELRGLVTVYNKFAVDNAIKKANQAISQGMDLTSNLKEGLSGWSFKMGQAATTVVAPAVIGIGAMWESLKAGGYSVFLGIIRDLLLSLFIIITPIMFLLGVLIPTWAPGVIATSIVAVVFLQMVEITVIIVNSVLMTVSKAFTNNIEGIDNYMAIQAILEYISAFAYMASFGLTAFLMFAVGDTKAIMKRLHGMDSYAKAGGTLAQEAVKRTFNVLAAGASGGATMAAGTALKSVGISGGMGIAEETADVLNHPGGIWQGLKTSSAARKAGISERASSRAMATENLIQKASDQSDYNEYEIGEDGTKKRKAKVLAEEASKKTKDALTAAKSGMHYSEDEQKQRKDANLLALAAFRCFCSSSE